MHLKNKIIFKIAHKHNKSMKQRAWFSAAGIPVVTDLSLAMLNTLNLTADPHWARSVKTAIMSNEHCFPL